ncbi:ceramidase domain-containing protein [Hyphomicrobium sp. LHD-15]|uniref:ceramidase domain-containing protein n=1 Tax=Hyphomicrobium sp. LHD-15 TaxID=3072142 RepID=UPI00280EF925|nr:ceramidase domain-containing protein [Hyphomicrobium sp. LHD-15]MDQ8698171.1 ceramidase domain-containing protein [Hyphomicrobium sp. LHD-15]
MSLTEKIFIYCERGQDPSFWAEPFNAVSNAAFIIAALVASRDYFAAPPERRSIATAALVALTFVIGIGSFLFHTYATRWASLADQIPIAVFMLAYLAFVLRRYLGQNWLVVLIGLAVFFACLRYAATISCEQGALLPITARAGARCLNGTAAYSPAWFALAFSAMLLAALRHPAWRLLALASVVFLVSMTFRTLDLELCELTTLGGHLRGTHTAWHVLNAVTLYVLLRAAILYGAPQQRVGDAARAAG